MPRISRLHLRENLVKILAPVCRSSFNHARHLGQKGDSVELTVNIRDAFLNPIKQYLFGKPRTARICSHVLDQADFDRLAAPCAFKLSLDASDHDRLVGSVKIHQLTVVGS